MILRAITPVAPVVLHKGIRLKGVAVGHVGGHWRIGHKLLMLQDSRRVLPKIVVKAE